MKGFDTLKVKSAVKSHNKFDLSRSHLTTMEFGQIIPLLVEETVPGDKFNISAEYFSRLAPLAKPTYGKFEFKTVSAFVPLHQIAYDAEAWLAGKTTFEGQTTTPRYIPMDEFAYFIYTHCCTTTGATAANSQFNYVDSSGTTKYNLFTKQGKYWIKILNALGYALPQGVDLRTTSSWYTSVRTTKLNAYPLLAFFKVYNDYMSQSQRYNTSPLSDFLLKVKYGKTYTSYYNASYGQIQSAGVKLMFDNLFLNYENDYFTSAWQNGNAPIASVQDISQVYAPVTNENIRYSTTQTYLTENVNSNAVNISQRALDMLKDFDNWVRRNNYSGSKAVQQVYSRFGIKTEDYKSHYANILGTSKSPIQVGDVTATTEGTNQVLGDYAGKGIMNTGDSVSCSVSDHGILLVLGYFTVSPMMSFGYDRRVLRNAPLDFYNPEFDGLGADAISLGEVYASPIASTADTTLDTQVFGFTERYNAYRYGRDVITGDFRDYRMSNTDMSCWHSGRNLTAVRQGGGLVAQSTSMNTLPQTDSEFNRIFSVTSGDVDHFYLTCRFKVDAIRPMMNLNQVVNLGEGDTVVPRNGNVIS